MNSQTPREYQNVPHAFPSPAIEPRGLAPLVQAGTTALRPRARKVFSGIIALAIQALFLAGLVYGTVRDLAPALETLTVVNILEETPVVEEPLPPPPPRLEQPVIQMQAPLVAITPSEPPPPKVPTAILSETPPPPPLGPTRTSDEDRHRLVAEFQHALQRHLAHHMRYPPAARARKEEGIVYVRVAMDRRGYVLSAKIQGACDSAQLNEESVAVVQRAQPLPVPPDVVAGDPVDLIIPVTFSLRMNGRPRRNQPHGDS